MNIRNEMKRMGFKTLIIWEHELKNMDVVLEKIRRFDKSA